MKEFTATIIDEVGIHARPASALAKVVSQFKSETKVISGTKSGNLKSVMNLMSMAIKSGTSITIQVSGEDEDQAMTAIQETLKDLKLI